jgi:cell division protein ZapA
MTTTKKTTPVPVAIHIMDKEYKIACPADEKDGLVRAATYVDEQMKKVRDSGRLNGTDRIAVMAALNIAHEMLSKGAPASETPSEDIDYIHSRIKFLQNKVDSALAISGQLEL